MKISDFDVEPTVLAEIISGLSPESFEEMVRLETIENSELLERVSQILDGKNILDVTMWMLSFVFSTSSVMSSTEGRKVLKEIFLKMIECLEVRDKKNEPGSRFSPTK